MSSLSSAIGKGKPHVGWIDLDKTSNGRYGHLLKRMAVMFEGKGLSITHLRICVLVRETYTSSEIASLLTIEERTVETYRSRIHKLLGLDTHTRLSAFLLSLEISEPNYS